VELLLSREIHIETLDSYGNNPLHFAAKHGHIDLCKFLIEKGCSVLKRNNYQQTPYDVAQSHVVRQYLLPIQVYLFFILCSHIYLFIFILFLKQFVKSNFENKMMMLA